MCLLPVALLVLCWLTTGTAQAGQNRVDRLFAPAAACPEAADASPAAQLTSMECLVNYARAHAGVSKLRRSTALSRAATLKIDADIRCGDFTHTPCGQPLERVFALAGYSLGAADTVGENLAYGGSSFGSAQQIMQAWLASPEHRQILLSTGWTTFGIGLRVGTTFLGGSDIAVWANEFAER